MKWAKRIFFVSWCILKLWKIQPWLRLFFHVYGKSNAISLWCTSTISGILLSRILYLFGINLLKRSSLTHIFNNFLIWWFEDIKDRLDSFFFAFVGWCFKRIWLLLSFCFKRIGGFFFLWEHILLLEWILFSFCLKRI